jgi:hypothetical protein
VPGAELDVLPQQPVVLLVHAYRLLDGVRRARAVREGGVEVVDGAEAVAAQLQGVGAVPQAVIPDVDEGLTPCSH